MSRRGWNISREGDSTASLGSLGQGSVTLRGKKFFLVFSWTFLCFSLCPGLQLLGELPPFRLLFRSTRSKSLTAAVLFKVRRKHFRMNPSGSMSSSRSLQEFRCKRDSSL